MKNLRTLLAAVAIGAVSLLPISSSAQSRVELYRHGQRVNMGRTLSNRWNDIKSGVKYDSYKMSHGGRTSLAEQRQDARREGLYRMNTPSSGSSGVILTRNGNRVNMMRSTRNRFSDIKSGIRYNSYKLSHRGRTSLQEQRQDARRESLYRAGVNRQR